MHLYNFYKDNFNVKGEVNLRSELYVATISTLGGGWYIFASRSDLKSLIDSLIWQGYEIIKVEGVIDTFDLASYYAGVY